MSDQLVMAIVAGLAPTIAALGAMIVGIRNSRKADETIKKADEIHVLVNSQLSTVKADLVLALERVGKLEKLLIEKAK